MERITRPFWGAIRHSWEVFIVCIHRVAIIQPAVLHYRIPFFRRLIATAEKEGIQIDVFSGATPTKIRARRDSGKADFVHALPTRELVIRGSSIFYRSTAPVLRGNYHLVVVEHAIRNFETYELLLRIGGRRLAFWGHGRTYTKDVSPRHAMLKYWLTRQGTWFFGYTARGVDSVVEHGYPRSRTTVLNNAIDTAELQSNLSKIAETDILAFSKEHDLHGKTALYLGALDSYKRIPFLLESAVMAHDRCPDFRLLVAGDGSDRPVVEAFVERNSWATYLGTAHGWDKALALRAAQAVAIPGAIGLVALDSMVAGTPIVTTDFPHHGPEFDYLEDGTTAVVAPDSIGSYGAGLAAFLCDRRRLSEMSNRCRIHAEKYTLDGMVSSFLAGIKSALTL